MFNIRGKRLVITRSARREMDQLGMSVHRLAAALEAGARKLEGKKSGKWLVQDGFAGKFALIRFAELDDRIVVINIGLTTRKVV